MFPLLFSPPVPFARLLRCLHSMTVRVQPLKILKSVVVAGNDMIAVAPPSVTQWTVLPSLASVARAIANLLAKRGPLTPGQGKTAPAVARIPAHTITAIHRRKDTGRSAMLPHRQETTLNIPKEATTKRRRRDPHTPANAPSHPSPAAWYARKPDGLRTYAGGMGMEQWDMTTLEGKRGLRPLSRIQRSSYSYREISSIIWFISRMSSHSLLMCLPRLRIAMSTSPMRYTGWPSSCSPHGWILPRLTHVRIVCSDTWYPHAVSRSRR